MNRIVHMEVYPYRKASYRACGSATGKSSMVPRRVNCPECLKTALFEACKQWLKLEGATQEGSHTAFEARQAAWRKYRDLKEGGA